MSFRTVELSKFIKIQGGYAYKSNDFKIGGENPVLKIKNVRFGHIEYEDSGFISDELANSTDNFSTSEGDILISMTGSGPSAPQSLVGRVARVWQGEPKAWINQRVGRVILKEENKIHPDFIFYLLSSNSSQDFLVANSSGSANQANINGSTIGLLPCPDIDFNTSKEIAIILRSLDEKIRINRQINRTLEEIAQAIFKSWFVDFEPTKAKIAAREALLAENPATTPEQIATAEQKAAIQAIAGAGDFIPTEQLQTIADLFPNQLVDSELGEIPDGWEISEIGNEVKVCGGGTPSTQNAEYWDDGNIAWTTPKDLSGNTSKILIDTDRKITELGLKKISSGLLPVDTVLLSSRAPVGYLALAKIPVAVNQGYIAMVCDKSITPEFVINWCDSVMDEIKQRASGTTFSEISKKNFKLIKVTLPPHPLCEVYSRITKPLYNLISSNKTESKLLSSIRDSLLPKLLNGEIDCSALEASNE